MQLNGIRDAWNLLFPLAWRAHSVESTFDTCSRFSELMLTGTTRFTSVLQNRLKISQKRKKKKQFLLWEPASVYNIAGWVNTCDDRTEAWMYLWSADKEEPNLSQWASRRSEVRNVLEEGKKDGLDRHLWVNTVCLWWLWKIRRSERGLGSRRDLHRGLVHLSKISGCRCGTSNHASASLNQQTSSPPSTSLLLVFRSPSFSCHHSLPFDSIRDI